MFRLAGHLGMTVGELEHRMTSAEVIEWIAYWRLEPPFDPWTAFASILSAICNAFGRSKTKPQDFLPRAYQVAHRQSTQQHMMVFDLIRARQNHGHDRKP